MPTELWLDYGKRRPWLLASESNYHKPQDQVKLESDRLDMTGFFARSLTGIKFLVGDQYNEVRSVTGKEPKVSFLFEEFRKAINMLNHCNN
jgi:hypothetical protein